MIQIHHIHRTIPQVHRNKWIINQVVQWAASSALGGTPTISDSDGKRCLVSPCPDCFRQTREIPPQHGIPLTSNPFTNMLAAGPQSDGSFVSRRCRWRIKSENFPANSSDFAIRDTATYSSSLQGIGGRPPNNLSRVTLEILACHPRG